MNHFYTPWAVLAADGALLAFLIGIYTLVARDRKSPYLTNSLFQVSLLSVLSALASVVSVLLSDWKGALLVLDMAILLLLFAILCTAWHLYKFYVRFVYFVDRSSLKDWKLLRRIMRKEKHYEHIPVDIPSELLDEVKKVLTRTSLRADVWDERPLLKRKCLAIALTHQGQADDVLKQLVVAFLQNEYSVQYLTASRHPIEFLQQLADLPKDSFWQKNSQRIVVVDAFTPHFGFTDSIHEVKTKDIERTGISCIRSTTSYAGMHTATSKAFALIKARSDPSHVRKPVLVIYEDTRALADLESIEQYRIFVRHVVPSEGMWGGMFTVFLDVAPHEDDWSMLSAYAGFTLDMRVLGRSFKAEGEVEE